MCCYALLSFVVVCVLSLFVFGVCIVLGCRALLPLLLFVVVCLLSVVVVGWCCFVVIVVGCGWVLVVVGCCLFVLFVVCRRRRVLSFAVVV